MAQISEKKSSDCASPSDYPRFRPAHQNPFATNRWEQIPFRFPVDNWQLHLERLKDLRYRAAIVGPCGSGKSTLLRQLKPQLEAIGKLAWLLQLPHKAKEYPPLLELGIQNSTAGSILLVDGIERLSIWQRYRLQRQTPAGMIFACHRRPLFSKTWIRCKTDENLMQYVIGELGIGDEELLQAAQSAFRRCRGNVREALFQLYREHSQGRA